jgi:hypothetical protein
MQSIFSNIEPKKKKLVTSSLQHSSSLSADDDLGLELNVDINFKETSAPKKHIKIIEVKHKKKHKNEPNRHRRELF